MSAVPIGSEAAAVEQVLTKCGDIAVLPQVVFKIMEMTGSDESSAHALERSIVVDPGFSAKLLAQANSAYYSLPKKVISIREAIMFVGFKSVRQLAMAVGVFDMFVGKTDKESLRRRGWWRHSLDTAVCSRDLAQSLKGLNPEEGYTCGLLHLMGKTILDRFDPASYEKVEMLVERGAGDAQAEKAVFGCDHVQISRSSAAKWGFPDVLINGLDYRNPAEPDKEWARLRALVAISHVIAHIAVTGQGHDKWNEAAIPAWAVEALGIEPENLGEVVEGGVRAIASAAQMGI